LNEIRHIDLCSGIGGFALAARWAGARAGRDVRTIAFCEIDPFCQAVLGHHWPGVPIYDDIKTFDYEGGCDLLTAGYPCTPFSVAGKQKGAEDDRHLWPYVFEIVKRKRPAWCLFENVTGHITLGLDEVLLDLENEGYAARPVVIPACALDAPHRRDRVWIVAHSNSASEPGGTINAGPRSGELVAHSRRTLRTRSQFKGKNENEVGEGYANQYQRSSGTSESNVVDSSTGRCTSQETEVQSGRYSSFDSSWWQSEPRVGRVAHGIPNRVAQLRALGNSILPQVAAEIMEAMFRNWEGASK